MNENNKYFYTYSAKEQAEIKRIREKYQPQTENKIEQLRRLDASVTKKGNIISLVLGILGSLILGMGMSCIMVWGDSLSIFAVGVLIGVLGLVCMCLAYPLHTYITKKERVRITPEIIRLTDELMK